MPRRPYRTVPSAMKPAARAILTRLASSEIPDIAGKHVFLLRISAPDRCLLCGTGVRNQVHDVR